MKKIYLVAIAVLLASSSFLHAQKTRFGFTAGGTISNYHFKLDGVSVNGKVVAGMTAGLLVDIPISSNFSVQPALNLTQKGTRDETEDNGITEKAVLHAFHAELLANFLYNTPLKTGNFFIGAGPSISMGIFGKWKDSFGGNTQTTNVKFGNSDDDDIKPLDLGANFTTGFCSSNGILISASFNQGFSNLAPGGSDNGKVTSYYFGIRLGFLLNGTK